MHSNIKGNPSIMYFLFNIAKLEMLVGVSVLEAVYELFCMRLAFFYTFKRRYGGRQ